MESEIMYISALSMVKAVQGNIKRNTITAVFNYLGIPRDLLESIMRNIHANDYYINLTEPRTENDEVRIVITFQL